MRLLEEKDKEEYTKFIEKHERCNFQQSIEWGKVKSFWKNEIVLAEDKNGNIIGSISILIRKIPIFGNLMYSSRGPICDIHNIEVLKQLTDGIKHLAKKYNAFVLKMDPEIPYNESTVNNLKKAHFKVKSDFKDILEPMQTIRNMILHIDGKTEEEVMLKYSQKTRYNIRLAKKKGVTVRYSNSEEDCRKFYDLMVITAKRDKIAVRSYEYYKSIMEAFGNKARIYMAEYDGEPLASALCINYGKKVMYFYGASSNEKRNLMPTYLIQQEMINWAIESNCKEYNFGGIFNDTIDDGLYRFKSGFCKQDGYTKFIGEIDKVYKNSYYYVFSKVLPKVKKFMLNINNFIEKK